MESIYTKLLNLKHKFDKKQIIGKTDGNTPYFSVRR